MLTTITKTSEAVKRNIYWHGSKTMARQGHVNVDFLTNCVRLRITRIINATMTIQNTVQPNPLSCHRNQSKSVRARQSVTQKLSVKPGYRNQPRVGNMPGSVCTMYRTGTCTFYFPFCDINYNASVSHVQQLYNK